MFGKEAADPGPTQAQGTEDLDSTVELVERAKAGDQQAVERLFARHLKPLQRFASGRLPQWARTLTDTDDLVQDTLLRTFRRMPVFEARGAGALQAYLRQVVLNRIREELRSKGRQPDVTELVDVAADSAQSPLEHAIGTEALARYDRALARLRVEEREVIIARVEMGQTFAEVADALGKPSAEAARKAAHRALLRLAEEMQRARQ